MIKRTIKAHKRIIFNGNGYDDTWIQEATEKRGLLNLRTTPDAIQEILKPKNIEMLTTQRVYTEAELRSRYEIMLENYCKTVCIEAQTMSDMARKQILPAVAHYAADVARDAAGKQALDPDIRCGYEAKLVKKLTAVAESIDTRVDALDGAIARFKTLSDVTEGANFIRDEMLSRMTELRVAADEAETLTAESARLCHETLDGRIEEKPVGIRRRHRGRSTRPVAHRYYLGGQCDVFYHGLLCRGRRSRAVQRVL